VRVRGEKSPKAASAQWARKWSIISIRKPQSPTKAH
jgi:hypothetical protein